MTAPLLSAVDVAAAMEEIDAGLADLERAKRRIAKGENMLRAVVDPKTPRKAPARVVRLRGDYQFTEAELEAQRARLSMTR